MFVLCQGFYTQAISHFKGGVMEKEKKDLKRFRYCCKCGVKVLEFLPDGTVDYFPKLSMAENRYWCKSCYLKHSKLKHSKNQVTC